jgi:hypothetical protein
MGRTGSLCPHPPGKTMWTISCNIDLGHRSGHRYKKIQFYTSNMFLEIPLHLSHISSVNPAIQLKLHVLEIFVEFLRIICSELEGCLKQ